MKPPVGWFVRVSLFLIPCGNMGQNQAPCFKWGRSVGGNVKLTESEHGLPVTSHAVFGGGGGVDGHAPIGSRVWQRLWSETQDAQVCFLGIRFIPKRQFHSMGSWALFTDEGVGVGTWSERVTCSSDVFLVLGWAPLTAAKHKRHGGVVSITNVPPPHKGLRG